MKFALMVVILCSAHAKEFKTSHENPYQTGIEIAMKGGPEPAKRYFAACHRETGDKMCYYGLAYCLYLSGESEKALKMVETIVASGPHSEKFMGDLEMLNGLILLQYRDFELAEHHFDAALQHYENAGHAINIFKTLTALANAKMALGKLAEAEQLLEEANYIAIRDDVNLSYLHSLRAITHYTMGNLAAAERFAALSVEEYRALGNTRAVMGMLSWLAFYRYEQGNLEFAKDTLDQAVAMTKNSPETLSTELIRAYIYKCENPNGSNELFQRKAQAEKDYFIQRFLKTAINKKCK
ncbi:tetratricopeptide repeat protein [Acanthopleuribacter pedis]|uniref:Tetratricopeptide repeat protein n=1 Tax=Acanthopleuribacter pedis TaxID=442870 RepID=A0A8J7U6M7_9BACT|nr:tetratricopeptide repeat protein [Acanthopleuribacter pedis]MBO1320541.1 tetratricopeptide repeat protein [Acanthopleuribacter pedis]